MPLPYDNRLICRAKELRSGATKQEKRLWYDFLSRYPVRFQRQKTIGGFIADFYCCKASLVVELDGAQHYIGNGPDYDAERSAALEKYNIMVLRFKNSEIDCDFDRVCRTIDMAVRERSQKPPS